MSTAPELVPPSPGEGRNWLPFLIAAAVVLLVAAAALVTMQRRASQARAVSAPTPVSTPLDPYAGSLVLDQLAMSEAPYLAGGKLTYLDGHIANNGALTVTAVTVQVLFRNYAHEIAQNETQPLKLIRMREPYIDVQPVSAAPLPPGAQRDFRLIFDTVSPDWDGAYPEIRVLRVETH